MSPPPLAHLGPLDFRHPCPVAVMSPRVVTVEESGGGFVERVRYGRFGGRVGGRVVSGHNWGSQHDPLTRECVPASSEGGRFVMYMHSVSGRELNNKVGSRNQQ